MAAAAPTIRSRSPFGHLSKLAAIRAGSRKIGADAAAFPAPDADTRCTQLDVGEELWICGNPEMEGRYLLALLLSGWTHVFWLSGSHTIGTTSGWLERDAKLRDGQLAHP
jgi:hypothetical protein